MHGHGYMKPTARCSWLRELAQNVNFLTGNDLLAIAKCWYRLELQLRQDTLSTCAVFRLALICLAEFENNEKACVHLIIDCNTLREGHRRCFESYFAVIWFTGSQAALWPSLAGSFLHPLVASQLGIDLAQLAGLGASGGPSSLDGLAGNYYTSELTGLIQGSSQHSTNGVVPQHLMTEKGRESGGM